MDTVRAPQGLDATDRVALGLDATHLFYLVTFSMAAWALIRSGAPGFIRLPVAAVALLIGASLAWVNLRGRALDEWIVLYAKFRLRVFLTQRGATVGITERRLEKKPRLPVPAERGANGMEPDVVSMRAPRRARRVAFYSHAGGCGKTTLALESAALAAGRHGERVALIQLDPCAGDLGIRLGLEESAALPEMENEIADGMLIESAMRHHRSGISVIAGVAGSTALLSAAALARVLSHLDRSGYTLVVVDLGTGTLARQELPARKALVGLMDIIYCVFTASPSGIFNVYGSVATIRRAGFRTPRLVLNRQDEVVPLDDVCGDLRLEVTASVPTLPGVACAERKHEAACTRDLPTALALAPIIADIFPAGAVPRQAVVPGYEFAAAAP
ncbi:MAG: hypothetical protein ABR573_00245 [Candidatus Dormibacteria bacterium]